MEPIPFSPKMVRKLRAVQAAIDKLKRDMFHYIVGVKDALDLGNDYEVDIQGMQFKPKEAVDESSGKRSED